MGYSYSVWASTVHEHGFMGLSTPSLHVLGEITFGVFRGLFFISPVLLLVVPGFYLMWKQEPKYRDVVVLISIIIIGFFIYNSAYLVWWGGWSTGPRFLVPVLPIMTLPIIYVFNQWLRYKVGVLIITVLIVASTLNVWIQSTAYIGLSPDIIYVPDSIAVGSTQSPEKIAQLATYTIQSVANGDYISNPLFDFAIPHLQNNEVALNVGNQYGLVGLSSFIVLFERLGVIIIAAVLVGFLYRSRQRGRTTLTGRG